MDQKQTGALPTVEDLEAVEDLCFALAEATGSLKVSSAVAILTAREDRFRESAFRLRLGKAGLTLTEEDLRWAEDHTRDPAMSGYALGRSQRFRSALEALVAKKKLVVQQQA